MVTPVTELDDSDNGTMELVTELMMELATQYQELMVTPVTELMMILITEPTGDDGTPMVTELMMEPTMEQHSTRNRWWL
ncbi:hypothetical protein [Dolosigranulum savutiense]|uniref:Uncharacterized protein n=1 Tax=Dolosigranulum savutiense TaxID=3110288 RepID=A0AB74TPH6_9LACT